MSTTVVFGGFKMPMRVLAKYAAVYGPTTMAVPLTTTCMLAGTRYTPYGALHMEMRQRGPIHIHVVSGACHYLYRFMTMYPEHRERVVSQVYDSPANSDSVPRTLHHAYGIPVPVGRMVLRAFPDCAETSRRWMDGPLFDPSIPTGIVTSTRDSVSCADEVRAMIRAWRIKPEMLATDSVHAQSLRDEPVRYKDFCVAIRDRGC
jgi:hypothetical protein